MVTRSVQLRDEEAEALRQLQAATGVSEDEILRRAVQQGIRDLRLDEGIRAFKGGLGSGEAAVIAGLPRAIFLQEMIDRGVVILDGEPNLSHVLGELGRRLGDDRMIGAAQALSESE